MSKKTQFQSEFLKKLQTEAKLQAKLESKKILPSQLDWFTGFVGRYPWQVILCLSFLAAFVLEFA